MAEGLATRGLWRAAAPHRLAVAGLVLALSLALHLTNAFERVDLRVLDLVMGVLPWADAPEPEVMLVAIDDKALAEFGAWPWPRTLQARLVEALGAARVVGYNVALVDPAAADGDRAMAMGVAHHGGVVLPLLFVRAGDGMREAPPLAELVAGAAGLGHVAVGLDRDGVVRRVALWSALEAPLLPAFALEVLRVAGRVEEPPAGVAPSAPTASSRVAPARVRERLLPVGALAAPSRVSAADVLSGRAPAGLWADRIVIVGVTAEGTADRHNIGAANAVRAVSGSELQALIVSALARDATVAEAPWAAQLVVACVVVGLLCVAYLRRWSPVRLLLAGPLVAPLASVGLAAWGVWIAPSGAAASGVALAGVRLVEQRWAALGQLQRERRRADVILDAIDNAVVSSAPDGRIVFANRAALELLGGARTDLVGRDLSTTLRRRRLRSSGRGSGDHRRAGSGASTSGSRPRWALPPPPAAPVVELEGADGTARLVQLSRRRVALLDGGRAGDVLVMTDVTELARLQRELERLATIDHVTGLANRQFVNQHLPRAIARARREQTELAVLLIDIDHFKEVNDRFGHQAGDRLLDVFARRLVAICRADDVVARIGGDEFVIVMTAIRQRHHAAILAQKLLDAFREPIAFDGKEVALGLSIGVSCLDDEAGEGDAILGRADLAMYQAKRERNAFCLFSPLLDAAARRELELREELRHAVERGDFRLAFQPKVLIGTGGVIGFEALLRWRRPDGTPVSPVEFIPIAENAGLLPAMSDWVVVEAVRRVTRWRRVYGLDLSVAVNVSARYLLEPRLLAIVDQALGDVALPANRLVVEITESVLMQNRERAIAQMQHLKSVGCTLSIDDFGTGYSSLAYLRDLPIDQIKIDKSFSARIGHDERDDLIIEAITRMAQSLRIDVVAEGVETWEQARFLEAMSITQAQGFLFGRPMEDEHVDAWLADASRRVRRAGPLTGERGSPSSP